MILYNSIPDQAHRDLGDDLQSAIPLCRCAQCGREIYPGGDCLTDTPNCPDDRGATTIHTDCLMDWVSDQDTPTVAEAFGFHRAGGGR